MLSERLLKELNEQIKYEFDSAHIYLAMAGYFADQDLEGFENFFLVQEEEERFHAMKFYQFINGMGARVDIKGFEDPENHYNSATEVFEAALKHEQFITSRIYKLMDIAIEENEHATASFLKRSEERRVGKVDEQLEEEDTMTKILAKLRRFGEDGAGIMMLDKELSLRIFTPPVDTVQA